MTQPGAVYADPDGLHYVALFVGDDDEAEWLRWPARASGWLARRRCAAALADACEELPPDLARLALRLSGCRPQDDMCAPPGVEAP